MNYGNQVTIKFNQNGRSNVVLHNITEIHYNYKSIHSTPRVAFESDIHGTGITLAIDEIREFNTSLESSVSDGFYGA